MHFHRPATPTRKRRQPGVERAGTTRLCSLILLLCLCGAGCETQSGPSPMAGSYYLNPHKDLSRIGRVAMAELDGPPDSSEVSPDVSRALYVAIQKKQLFSVTTIPRDDPAWPHLHDDVESLEALRRLQSLRENLKCNALLVGTITEYEPYPRLVLGLRLKLVDLTDGQLLWGLEQVWDSADQSIQRRIKRYLRDQMRSEYVPLREEMVAVSALEFGKFAAYEVAETLNRDRSQP